MTMTSLEVQRTASNNIPMRRSAQERKVEELWRPISDWGAEEVAIWLRGVEKVARPVLENVLHAGLSGAELLQITSQRLAELGVDSVGKRYCILAAVASLRTAETYIPENPVLTLGSKLLSAGKDLESRPMQCILQMVQTITTTLGAIDTLLSTDDYRTRRQEVLVECGRILKLVAETQDTSSGNRHFVKKCKAFVRAVLPHLQELKGMLTSDPSQNINNFLHSVVVNIPPGAQAGLSIRQNDSRFIYISNLTPNEPADRTGLLAVGDEIVMLNGQNIIGWRTRSVAALLKQSTTAIKLVIRLPGSMFDARISRLMEHARALRNSIGSSSSTRPYRGSSTTSRRFTGSSTSTPRSSVINAMLTGEAEESGGIDIISPSGREEWAIGTPRVIKWDACELPRHVTLAIRAISKRACFNLQIAPVVVNTGEYTWTLTADILPSDDYQIIISALVGDREVVAISQRFAVVSSPALEAPPAPRSDRRASKKLKAREIRLSVDREGTFGFEIDAQFVSDITPQGPAHVEGRLQIGDQIIEVNGCPVLHLSHIAINNLLHETGNQVTLVVADNLEGYKAYLNAYNATHDKFKSKLVCRQVDLQPTPAVDSFGLSLIGSHNIITVGSVMEGLPASKCPHLKTSTGIVQVNGCPAYGASVLDVLKLMQFHRQSTLSLVVTQDTDDFVHYSNDVLHSRDSQLLTEGECAAAKANMSRRFFGRSRSNSVSSSGSRASVRDVLVRRLSFGRNSTSSAASSEARDFFIDPVVETPCSSLRNPSMQGWLTKQGGSGLTPKNWRRRWFVLKSGAVYYYKTPEDAVALGCFSLRGYLIMPPPPKKHMYNKFGFKISREDKRSYFICADSAEEMKAWMNALSLAAIQYAPTDGSDARHASRAHDGGHHHHHHQRHHPHEQQQHRLEASHAHHHPYHSHHHASQASHDRRHQLQQQEHSAHSSPRNSHDLTAHAHAHHHRHSHHQLDRRHTPEHNLMQGGDRSGARLSNTSAQFA
ncbi:hypothetical protein PTSG_07692 [Salpingoeca rosetta]|uniref:Uncharacterized protein n=1 Tax=Salpingoeca rosetta (strain ATCC 50818 / BSB-021) TaxID=946362 RepID=F2UHH6_SALR5|nr:uncharacterized protein PTSG_07692 [Salpingoeca rosetta]EGD76575.1 hypothetical protein PTSG_07692 [Salpingoeca rosetta]|eukprot:XP_004991489.1 hypothetical protein PTSG_07692 [Salpingoeca rosetta]